MPSLYFGGIFLNAGNLIRVAPLLEQWGRAWAWYTKRMRNFSQNTALLTWANPKNVASVSFNLEI